MTKKRKRLKYTSSYVDRHGRERWVFRRVGYERGYFSEAYGTMAFKAEYDAFMERKLGTKVTKRIVRPRSIDDLLQRYYGSNDFKGNAQPISLSKRRAALEAFRDGSGSTGKRRGDKLVKSLDFYALDKIIAKAAEKKENGTGGPHAAAFLKKQLNGALRYAKKLGWIDHNPMEFVSYTAPKTDGYHSITEDEIDRYRARHPLGTNARLALEILLWTGKRRSDGRVLGRQNYRDGMMWGRDSKTKKDWWLPIAPQLQAAINAMPPHDHLCFLVSSLGKPYSEGSLGNMFRKWFDEAGLPHCTAHGLRKAISRRMADLEISEAGGMAITMHSDSKEYQIYVRAANQKRLANSSIGKVSEWEMSNRDEAKLSDLAKNSQK